VITAFIVALPDEARSLTQQSIKPGDCVFIRPDSLLCCSGTGSTHASQAARNAIQKGASRLVSWGCAAGLNPELKPGDLLIPNRLIPDSSDADAIDLSSDWQHHIQRQLADLKPIFDPLAEASTLIEQAIDKSRIFNTTRASGLDMESVAIARVAHEHECPILVLRCIADPFDMTLPKAVTAAMTPEGTVSLKKLFAHLLRHPAELMALIRLGQHFKQASNKLNRLADRLDIISGFESKTSQ
jgi:adenosylhomocysteine nucleosidase